MGDYNNTSSDSVIVVGNVTLSWSDVFDDHLPTSDASSVVLTVLYVPVFLMSLFGNCTSLIILIKTSTRLTRVKNAFLLNLVGADIAERQTEGSVAFSFFLQNEITNLGIGQIIKYDGEMVNDGNGYDVNTGIFTVPVSGLYLFSIVVEDYHEQDLWVELKQDGYTRAVAVAEPYQDNQHIMGGNIVILYVNAGSKIRVVISRGNRVQEGWSTFSGVLLH